jgi:hypothetical protein
MHLSKQVFAQAIRILLAQETYQFNGFVYRFNPITSGTDMQSNISNVEKEKK